MPEAVLVDEFVSWFLTTVPAPAMVVVLEPFDSVVEFPESVYPPAIRLPDVVDVASEVAVPIPTVVTHRLADPRSIHRSIAVEEVVEVDFAVDDSAYAPVTELPLDAVVAVETEIAVPVLVAVP